MRLNSSSARDDQRRRRLLLLLAAGTLSTLQSCFLFNEFKTSAWGLKDDCFSIVSADLCIDFDSGVLSANGLSATVGGGANCHAIRSIKMTGWVDKDGDGAEGPGEAIESFEHTVSERSGSSSVQLGNVSLALNATPSEAADVHVRVEVERVGGTSPQVYHQELKKC